MSIALKEANETEYWLQMIKEGNYITDEEYQSIHRDCEEIIKILVSILKTSKNKWK